MAACVLALIDMGRREAPHEVDLAAVLDQVRRTLGVSLAGAGGS
jgi:hypothetical protein